MKILVVNPNTTASMTGKIGAAARAVAAPGTEIVAVNPGTGPVSDAYEYPGYKDSGNVDRVIERSERDPRAE